MTERIEKIFTNFANEQEDSLKQMGMTKEEFIENAKEWSKTKEGKLEIQKFILTQEIKSLQKQIDAIQENINKKEETIKEIDEEITTI